MRQAWLGGTTALKTDFKEQPLLFQGLGPCKVVAIAMDVMRCFVEHELDELVSQRVLRLAAGYEDLNDHNHLRLDPLFAVAIGKTRSTWDPARGTGSRESAGVERRSGALISL